MAVKIRLRRVGSTNRPMYRIVVVDERCKRDGKYLEEIGYYNPLINPPVVMINDEIALKWLKNGAITTKRVYTIFKKKGILDKFRELKRKPNGGN
ncbi:MAG: 30S ribosomal protein S16 [bacterium]